MNATFSFEIFAPKSDAASAALITTIAHLSPCRPRFWSVTDGAGGSNSGRTLETARLLGDSTGDEVAVHLTAVGRSQLDIADRLNDCRMAGIRRIVAIRGDLPHHADQPDIVAGDEGGQISSIELIDYIKRLRCFEISAGCYPEPHPHSKGRAVDLDYLKRKQDAGADRLISQYCFDTETILRFRDQLHKNGIVIPFVPGVMPIKRFSRIRQFSARIGAGIPAWLHAAFDGVEEGTSLHAMIAAGIAADQCRTLVQEGLSHLHIYCLNDALLTEALARILQTPKGQAIAA